MQKLKLDSAYTPQMIVDGRTEFAGTDLGKAAKAITDAAKNQKATIEIEGNSDSLTVKIGDLPDHENSTVFLAIAEDNLISNVARGENSGKTLEHQSVVRELKTIGTLGKQQKSAQFQMNFQLGSNWKKENLKIIVFVQENESRKVLGVGRISPAKN